MKLCTIVLTFLAIYPDGTTKEVVKSLTEAGYRQEYEIYLRACSSHSTCIQITGWSPQKVEPFNCKPTKRTPISKGDPP